MEIGLRKLKQLGALAILVGNHCANCLTTSTIASLNYMHNLQRRQTDFFSPLILPSLDNLPSLDKMRLIQQSLVVEEALDVYERGRSFGQYRR